MPRWIKRCVWAVVLGGALPASVMAQPEPVAKPAKSILVVNNCPYRAATAYNATVVNRPVPAPHWNMPNFVFCCELPNQNLDGYVYQECCGHGRGGWGGGCDSGCDNGCGSIFSRFGGCGNGCNNSCSSGCSNSCNNSCQSGGGSLFSSRFSHSCGSSCNSGCSTSCNSCQPSYSKCNKCESGCGSIFGSRLHNRGNDCGSCNSDCQSSCNSCDHGCGSLFGGWRDRFSCKKDSCDDGCDKGHRNWFRWNSGCSNDCGCSSPCNSGCGSVTPSSTPTPAPVQVLPKTFPTPNANPVAKPVSYDELEPIGFWDFKENHRAKKERAEERENGCLNCPVHGPTPKHVLPRPTTLGCTGCSSLESEAVFIFGSCRQFFGEPTHKWMHGK